ncbi:hypothetical protein KCM76_12460 [Zooshikella marina]|uniref:hypothetical protein n=1 Tax=Zooshikella ganghwensis TaxID=202772 RepID=UPI001BB05AD3|nr:hypothetical protein [Zooshikella ganghwensis]MBU2706797.1 hypothetical protein [Zooshikella ganghwensis]
MKSALTIFLALLLISCKVGTEVFIDIAETYTVSINESGKHTKKYTINPGSEKHAKLVAWLKQNNSDWDPTPASYVPGLVVEGTGFSLNFMRTGVILNCKEGQFTKSVKLEDYEYLLQ